MKLLIITSELLNPEHILSSTFELSQAQILGEIFEVAILSVKIQESLSAKIKQLIKKGISGKNENILGSINESIRVRFFGKEVTHEYRIEGIPVYEGLGYYIRSPRKFKNVLSAWIKVGMKAFTVYMRDYGKPDLIHAHGRFLSAGALALRIRRKYGIKYVYTEHSTNFQSGTVPSEAVPILNKVVDNASLYIAVSQPLLRHVEKKLQRTIKSAIIVPNVVDKLFETTPDGNFIPKGKFIYTVIASIEPKKGIDILIKAFKLAFNGDRRYQLNICGEGPMKTAIIRQINEMDLTESIICTGNKSKSEIINLLDETHVFVLPSRIETFGVVVIEALARGKPVF
jgi:glycosyltransferase involved in cell wall biosynthesis